MEIELTRLDWKLGNFFNRQIEDFNYFIFFQHYIFNR